MRVGGALRLTVADGACREVPCGMLGAAVRVEDRGMAVGASGSRRVVLRPPSIGEAAGRDVCGLLVGGRAAAGKRSAPLRGTARPGWFTVLVPRNEPLAFVGLE